MKRTVKYALSAVLTAAIVVPALAQDNFPDVPENHWAYEALGRLHKDGILVGYPNDGKYRGARPATRYELAVAINAAYNKLKDVTEDLSKQISALSGKLDSKANQSDVDDIKKALDDLKNQISGLPNYASDIADLKNLTSKFEKELASIGVDVDELKKNLSDLDKRVTALENKKLPVDIHGDVNAFIQGGYSTGGKYGITVDGRPTGYGTGSYNSTPVGVDRDLTFLHEVGIELSSTNTTGPKWRVVGVAGNTVGMGASAVNETTRAPFGSISGTSAGVPFGPGATTQVYFQNFEVMLNEKLAGIDFSADLGRVGYKVSPFIFQRPNVAPYYDNARWSNGEYSIDGGILGFSFGSAKLTLAAGTTNSQTTSDGTAFQTLTAGGNTISLTGGLTPGILTVDRVYGATVGVPFLGKSSVDASYLILDSDTQATVNGNTANRVVVYGGDVQLNGVLPLGINAYGGYSRSDLMNNGSKVVANHNQRASGGLTWDKDKYGLNASYMYVEGNYGAPGDWGRIGIWWNPTDVKGPMVDGYYNISRNLTFKASGAYINGISFANGGTGDKDKVTKVTGDLVYKFAPGASADLGVETDDWSFSTVLHGGTANHPYERWYNLGLNFDLASNTTLKVLWQLSDYNSKGNSALTVFGQPTAKGGLITTQLSIKF